MWKIKKGLILSAVLLSLWLSPLLSGSHAQARQVFTIYDTELTQLEQSLTTLEQHSKDKQILLDKQAKQLSEAQEQLKIANRANQEISRIERTDAELIRESKSILERVRERGGTENQN